MPLDSDDSTRYLRRNWHQNKSVRGDLMFPSDLDLRLMFIFSSICQNIAHCPSSNCSRMELPLVASVGLLAQHVLGARGLARKHNLNNTSLQAPRHAPDVLVLPLQSFSKLISPPFLLLTTRISTLIDLRHHSNKEN